MRLFSLLAPIQHNKNTINCVKSIFFCSIYLKYFFFSKMFYPTFICNLMPLTFIFGKFLLCRKCHFLSPVDQNRYYFSISWWYFLYFFDFVLCPTFYIDRIFKKIFILYYFVTFDKFNFHIQIKGNILCFFVLF